MAADAPRSRPVPVLDSHVHFWDPVELTYPWLAGLPALDRAFGPAELSAALGGAPVDRVLFVEANCLPAESGREVARVARLARDDARIAGVVAFADLTDSARLPAALDALSAHPLVVGVRHNIQGHAPGFCVAPAFVAGVREVGRRGLVFDLCATHDQLDDVLALVRRCPDTAFVLDHCGKPAIRDARLEPWAAHVAALAAHENVCCKLSGLRTEAAPGLADDDALLPFALHAAERFGPDRVLYGSDWPVLSLAGSYAGWYGFTERLTAGWTDGERRRFYRDNAARVYRL